jgi:hypothetical protein
MKPVGFEPAISAGEQRQTYGLERAATGNGKMYVAVIICSTFVKYLTILRDRRDEPKTYMAQTVPKKRR